MVCPDGGTVDHLHGVVVAAFGKGFEHQVPQAAGRPAPILPVHRVLIAEFLGQIPPGCAGTSDPEDRIEYATVVARRATPQRAGFDDKRLEKRSFLVGQKAPHHC